jgi:murein DD-endopeptidase MepM/ murein hydrolase activator NlpD
MKDSRLKDTILSRSRGIVKAILRLLVLILFAGTAWKLYGIFVPKEDLYNANQKNIIHSKPDSISNNFVSKSFIVKQGDNLLNIFLDNGLSATLSHSIYNSIKSIGFKWLFPGDSVILNFNSLNSLIGFSVLSRLNDWYHVEVTKDSILAKKIPVSPVIYKCLVRGVITSSLYEDLYKLGIGDACITMFADIFSWDINFFVDPQKGDSFEMIFEKKYSEGKFIGYRNILAARYVNKGKSFFAIGVKNDDGTINYYDINGESLQKQFLKAPLRYCHISSFFSYKRKHPILGIIRPHLGIDYAAPVGTPVYAAADGKVRFAAYKGDYGNMICLSHGGSYESFYGHLKSFAYGIKSGSYVKQGECIGFVGQTGLATGPHLDYRMKRNGSFINPLKINSPSKTTLTEKQKNDFNLLKQEFLTILSLRLLNICSYIVIDIDEANNKES